MLPQPQPPRDESGGGASMSQPPAGRRQPQLGERVKLWFPDDQEWYSGEIAGHNASSGTHRIVYHLDGEVTAWGILSIDRKWTVRPFFAAAHGNSH